MKNKIILVPIFLCILLLIGCDNSIPTINIDNSNIQSVDNTEIDYIKTKIDFADSEYLAIGYVKDDVVADDIFADTYFESKADFDKMEKFDLRVEGEKGGNRFIIVPKSDNIKINAYTLEIDEEANLNHKDKVISDYNKPFILYIGEMEYIPLVSIEYSSGDVKKEVPIQFSGENGMLYFGESKDDIKDISMGGAMDTEAEEVDFDI